MFTRKIIANPLLSKFLQYIKLTSSSGYEAILDVTLVILLTSAAITLSLTWLHGYHTLRQILYGALAGLLSHYGLTLALSKRRLFFAFILTRSPSGVY